jgi:hypothetical protein
MSNLLEVVSAHYLHDKLIHMKFNNNEEFDINLAPMIENDTIGIFKPLRDNNVFKQFKVDYTLCWNDDIDIAPEYLYFLAHKENQDKQQLFKDWGYIK